jgi:hypothetical protein
VVSEPKNTDAWKTYIENYYLIETGGFSPCILWAHSRGNCPESQKELIRDAFRNCGNDSTIAIWHRFIFPTSAPLPDSLEIVRFEKPQENITVMIKHEDHSWSDRSLSPDELSIVEKAYAMSNDRFFVLKKTPADEDTQKKLVEILGGSELYRNRFCRDLQKLQKGGK